MYIEFTKKKVFEQLMLAVATPACCRHGRQTVSIPECDLTGMFEERDVKVYLSCLLGCTRDRHFLSTMTAGLIR